MELNKMYKIVYVGSASTYGPFNGFLHGQLIEKVGDVATGYWHEFCSERVRQKFNRLVGFSDKKRRYIFDGAILADMDTKRFIRVPKTDSFEV